MLYRVSGITHYLGTSCFDCSVGCCAVASLRFQHMPLVVSGLESEGLGRDNIDPLNISV